MGLGVADAGSFMYWADVKIIKQTSLEGSTTTTLVETGKLSGVCKFKHKIIVIQNPLYHLVTQHPFYHSAIQHPLASFHPCSLVTDH